MVMGIAAVPICDMHSPEEMLYAIFACIFPELGVWGRSTTAKLEEKKGRIMAKITICL